MPGAERRKANFEPRVLNAFWARGAGCRFYAARSAAVRILGSLGRARVDFMQDENGNFQIIEVNTVPGLTQTSLFPKAVSYEGVNFKDMIAKILLLACKGH